jgi:hypothetical protein
MGLLKEVASTNGWSLFTKLNVYGTEYRLHALVTAIGLGANRLQDAIYPVGEVDAGGKPFDGANRYLMHFPAGQLPPVDGFWSLTMYDGQYFFVPNKLDRYTLSAPTRSSTMATGRLIFTYRQATLAQRRRPTGCRRRRAASSSPCCAFIGQRRHRPRFSTAPGCRRRSRK